MLAASVLLSANLLAATSGQCGPKITCKPGEKAQCVMQGGTPSVFRQHTFLPLTTSTSLFLNEVYAYKADSLGVADCYYLHPENPDFWLIFKTHVFHSVIPRDSTEWQHRWETLWCDTDIHQCLLFVLY